MKQNYPKYLVIAIHEGGKTHSRKALVIPPSIQNGKTLPRVKFRWKGHKITVTVDAALTLLKRDGLQADTLHRTHLPPAHFRPMLAREKYPEQFPKQVATQDATDGADG